MSAPGSPTRQNVAGTHERQVPGIRCNWSKHQKETNFITDHIILATFIAGGAKLRTRLTVHLCPELLHHQGIKICSSSHTPGPWAPLVPRTLLPSITHESHLGPEYTWCPYNHRAAVTS